MADFIAKHKIGIMLLIIALLIGAASFYFTRPALEVLRLSRASVTWSQTTAQVLSASIDSSYGSRSTSSSASYHEPRVRYAYQLDGQSYESNQIRFAHLRLRNRAGKANANKILDPYRNNPKVNAYYNPEKPSQSVLEPGVTLGSLNGLINTAIGFAISLGIIILAFWLESPLTSSNAETSA